MGLITAAARGMGHAAAPVLANRRAHGSARDIDASVRWHGSILPRRRSPLRFAGNTDLHLASKPKSALSPAFGVGAVSGGLAGLPIACVLILALVPPGGKVHDHGAHFRSAAVQEFARRPGAPRRLLRTGCRRGSCPDGRERSRKVDADEDP